MLRAFWTWDPVSSGTNRAFDEPWAYGHNKWFFDKSVWQKMFRAMSGCGFNAMILANTHPFPFMIDLHKYPDAKVIDDASLAEYQRMHRWVFETALDYDIAPYVLFFSIYYPSKMLDTRGIEPGSVTLPTDFAVEYTHACVRELLETYPELSGIVGDASEGITDRREEFVQQTIVDAMDAVRPDAALYLRGGCAEPGPFVEKIKRRGNRPIRYSVPYTCQHLVDSNPDPMFTRWVEAAGAENVAAEFSIANYEPWTCFSYETVDEIVSSLAEAGCDGFSLQPLSLYDWPRSSDTFFKYQWQRDLIWYHAWGGRTVEQLIQQGQPKWLLRNRRLLPGFQAGARVLELLALYLAGDRKNQWHPQFCSIRDHGDSPTRLLSIEDMLRLEDQPVFSGKDWWRDVTGDRVVHLAEYVTSGTPDDAYGPEELIEELTDLSQQAVAAGEKGLRNASGEKELPSLSRDALCMGRLGEFYVERFKAALAHARGEDAEAIEHMTRALGLFKEIRSVDSSHRGEFRVVTGRAALVCDWSDIVKALEAELEDAGAGKFKRGRDYPIGSIEGTA